jgi:hypothetical protein
MGHRLVRLKASEIASKRKELLKQQQHTCPLCKCSMKAGHKNPALDHDHNTGYIRDVLCINCNGMEGKVFNLARRASNTNEVQWLEALLCYYLRHNTPQHGGLLHPTHRTDDEKRIARNKRARKKRMEKKHELTKRRDT